MAQTFHDDKRKQKEAMDCFVAGKTHQKNKDLTAAGMSNDVWPFRANKSSCNLMTNRVFSAVESFTQAIMLKPERAEFFYHRGNCYNKVGDTSKVCINHVAL